MKEVWVKKHDNVRYKYVATKKIPAIIITVIIDLVILNY